MPRAEPPQPVGATVCVLLHHPDRVPPVRLSRALAGKMIDVRPCTDLYTALQTVCTCAKTCRSGLCILLICEPDELEGLVELVTLARTYAPSSVCWIYTSKPSEQVRELRDSDLKVWQSDQPAPEPGGTEDAGRSPPSGPALRYVPDETDAPGNGPAIRKADNEEGANGGSVLTDEELSMLLSDDPPERAPDEDDDEDR